jgi:L-proline---[L-prolyl-carrier protein] ligase
VNAAGGRGPWRGGPFLVDQLLRDAAERSPDQVALRVGSESITYSKLDAAADRVASALAEQGVGLGDRVGLHLEKSIAAVAALYGTMRAGAAYVPIDPAAPPLRAAYLATDCSVRALVSDPERIAMLRDADPAAAPRGITVGLGDPPVGFIGWNDVNAARLNPPRVAVTDADLAYILYTSGSTGRPKGVAITHRNSLTFIRWALHELELRDGDVFSNHAPFHFDLSTLDLFGAAGAVATVSIVPNDAAMFPVMLADWIRSERITVWYSVPSALSMLVRYGGLETRALDSLRLVLFAGEVFPTRYLSQLMHLVPQARFFNLYGPTETNVCTFEEVSGVPQEDDPPISIGRACENYRCVVTDEDGTVMTGAGSKGELIVKGSCVARGYWGDPGKTAAGFPDAFTYRTGDLVEILDDSTIPRYRFIGRRDNMIKTRGYRVELGEVESALYAHPAVSECVAVPLPDELMGNRIIAFCTVSRGADAEELIRACRERLPAYMAPTQILVVPSLPKTPNDKYDRAALAKKAAETADQPS